MNKKSDLSGIILAVLTGISVTVLMLVRAFAPSVILPKVGSGGILGLSLIALVINYYCVGEIKHNYCLLALYGGLVFGLFPYLACFMTYVHIPVTAIWGAAFFSGGAWFFNSVMKRLLLGNVSVLAPVMGALGIYLAMQCLITIV